MEEPCGGLAEGGSYEPPAHVPRPGWRDRVKTRWGSTGKSPGNTTYSLGNTKDSLGPCTEHGIPRNSLDSGARSRGPGSPLAVLGGPRRDSPFLMKFSRKSARSKTRPPPGPPSGPSGQVYPGTETQLAQQVGQVGRPFRPGRNSEEFCKILKNSWRPAQNPKGNPCPSGSGSDSMVFRWNTMEYHGIPWYSTYPA